jgi:hypothetical protein
MERFAAVSFANLIPGQIGNNKRRDRERDNSNDTQFAKAGKRASGEHK